MEEYAFEDLELGRILIVKDFPFPKKNIEPGYVIVDLKSENPFTEKDIFVCTKYDNLPKYSILNICSNENIPSGWKQKASFPSIYCSKEKSGERGRRKPTIRMSSYNNKDIKLENGKFLFKNVDCGEVNYNFIDINDCIISGELHIIGIVNDGQLVHTIKYSNGYWRAYKNIGTIFQDQNLKFMAVGIESIENKLHLCAIDSKGDLYHAFRNEDGEWEDFKNINELKNDLDLKIKSIALENIDDNLHIRVIADKNELWHAIRYDDENWYPFTKDVIIEEKELSV